MIAIDRPIVIAEIGNNHEGDIGRAIAMVHSAVECGADILKFQAGTGEGFARQKDQIAFYKNFELGRKGYDTIIDLVHKLHKAVMFSIWSDEFEYIRDVEDFHKIPARQFTTETIRRWDTKNTFISIPHKITTVQAKFCDIKQAVPLHCVCEYPAQDAMLWKLALLKSELGRPVGYSDHCMGIMACRNAIRMGAVAIEKHFTLDHNQSDFRDHVHSADPQQMRELCDFATYYKQNGLPEQVGFGGGLL